MEVIGVNIPAPKVRIDKNLLGLYADLYKGIRDRKDTVSWRTLVTTIKKLLGVDIPDYGRVKKGQYIRGRKLIKQLVSKTFLEKLGAEIEYAVGVRRVGGRNGEKLDYFLLSGRHFPEKIIFQLADYIKQKGKSVCVVNPVGHYTDGQTRVIGPQRVFRDIDRVVILSSTQSKFGGSVSVLSNVIRLIRNPDFAKKIREVDVVIPMFGGSRGHRSGQNEQIGFEVMEAGFNAKLISLPAKDLLLKLGNETKKIPKFKFFSLDVHNDVYPKKVFTEEGFDFASLDPSLEFSEAIVKLIKSKGLTKAPIRLVACDTGAVVRTKTLAERILRSGRVRLKNLQVIYLEKIRPSAGVVSNIKIVSVENWKKNGKGIVKSRLKAPLKPIFTHGVIIYSDDMIDTGGTAEKDLSFISSFYPNDSLKIFVATHPVFSNGIGALRRIGADYFFLGNTLSVENLEDISGVTLVSLAPTIYKAIS